MEYNLENFYEAIKALPRQTKYTRDDLLMPDFLLEKDKAIEIYYSLCNEYLNKGAKIFIVGITLGFEQMATSIKEAKICLEEHIPLGKTVEEVLLNLANEGLLNQPQILKGFPHPSGANGHRFKQIEQHKNSMIQSIETWFTNN